MDKTPKQQEVNLSPPSVAPPDQRGGYDCEFVERPQELQKDCPICLVVLREPFQVTCCGYSFCRTCIERIQTNKNACPTCKKASVSVYPNKGLQRSLYAFQVRCVHQKSGCEWTGELGKLDRHLNVNPDMGKQLNGCAFAALACTHCGQYFQRHHVQAHESESCPQRPFSCVFCEDYHSVYKDVVNNHWLVCKYHPVPCPNACGVTPKRQDVETHVNTVCSLTVVKCEFHYAGCEVNLARKDMPTHLAESLVTHISLLTTQTQMLEGKCGQDNTLLHLSLLALHQLTQLTIQQKESLEECRHNIQELKREKQAQATVIADLQKCSETRKHEIEALIVKLNVNDDVEQEVAKLTRSHQDKEVRASHVGTFPVEFKMTNVKEAKKDAKEWYSSPFYTHPFGYKMCLGVDANGWGDGKGTHVSVFVYLMKGEFDDDLKWPFQGSVILQLCNQLEDKYHCGDTIHYSRTKCDKSNSRVTGGEKAENGRGSSTFIAHESLEFNPANNCQYLNDNCFQFRIITERRYVLLRRLCRFRDRRVQYGEQLLPGGACDGVGLR